jgi:hypothetical protein
MAVAQSPVQLVQAHLDAINQHDVDGALSVISRDVVVRSNETIDTGNDYALYADYLNNLLATNPHVKADLLDRMSLGEVVIDEFILVGLERGSFHALAIYEIRRGKIAEIRFIAESDSRKRE